MLDLTVTIAIKERPATELVHPESFADDGRPTGMKTEEEFQAEMDDMKGRVFYDIQARVDNKQLRMQSAVSSREGGAIVDDRPLLVEGAMARLGGMLFKFDR